MSRAVGCTAVRRGRSLRAPLAALSVVAALTHLASPEPVRAHDVWIEPSSYVASPGSTVALHLRVGHAGEAAAFAAEPGWIERLVAVGPNGASETRTPPGGRPAAYAQIEDAGTHVVGLRSRPARSEIPAERFEGYLREEGLDHVLAAREARGTNGLAGREEYSRFLKCLIASEGTRPERLRGYDRPLGFGLELIPESNPFDPHEERLVVRLLRDAAPEADVLVEARPLAERSRGAARTVTARTGSDGRAVLPFGAAGARPTTWLVTAVTMTEAPRSASTDWRSAWAALTFERPSR